jgi:transposase/copper chaperone CopZ
MDDSRQSAHHVFPITNMHCDDCAALINETLRALPGVHRTHATAKTGTIEVDLDPRVTTPATVSGAITGLGFRLKPAQPKECAPDTPAPQQVSDAAWLLLEPVLRPRGTPARDLRQVFEGIACKHRAGLPWREVPAAFGPWQTLYAKYARWRTDGTWSRLVTAAAARPDLADELAWLRSIEPAT